MLKWRLYLAISFALMAGSVLAQESVLPIATIIQQANSLDNAHVAVRGEVIGDIFWRGQHAWINIQDKTGQIGIWTAKELLTDIKFLGDYKTKGDVVEIRGDFHRANQKLGGEAAIVAHDIQVIVPGSLINHEIKDLKIQTMASLAIITIIIIGIAYRRQKRTGL